MLKTILASFAALLLLGLLAGGIVVGAKAISVPINKERYESCLASAAAQHEKPDCPKVGSLWDRGFDDPVAYYTLWLALFTMALAVGGCVQSILIGRQISLARDEFNATHRPHIVVRSTQLVIGSEAKGASIIDFMAANDGDTPAQIISFRAIGYIQGGSSIFLPLLSLKGTKKEPDRLMVLPGTGVLIRAEGPDINDAYKNWLNTEGGNIFIVGEIEYKGRDNITRLTGFCRIYDRADGTWMPSKNPAYEYN